MKVMFKKAMAACLGFFLLCGVASANRLQWMTDAINSERYNYGLGQLHWDDSLMNAAFVHARDMANGGNCDHAGLYERVAGVVGVAVLRRERIVLCRLSLACC